MGETAAGEAGDVAGNGWDVSGLELLPGLVDEGAHRVHVVPAGRDAGAGFRQHAGHGAVLLADAQDGSPGRQVFEQFAGKDGTVLRVIPEGQDKHRGGELLPHGRQVVLVTQVHDIVLEPGLLDGLIDLAVHFAHEPKAQGLFEVRLRPGLDTQYFPESQRIAVGGKESRMDNVEMPVRFHRLLEIAPVVPVRDHGDRGRCLGLELLLHERRDGEDRGTVVQDGLLHRPQPAPGAARHGQMLEVVHPAPGVAEIRDPGNAEVLMQPLPDEVHRVGRSRRNDHIDRMFLEIFLQEPDARTHPAHAGVGDEQVAPALLRHMHEQVAPDPER